MGGGRTARRRSAANDHHREIVALHGLSGVFRQLVEHALQIASGGSDAIALHDVEHGCSPNRTPKRLRASLTPSVNSSSRSGAEIHGRDRACGSRLHHPIGGSMAGSRSIVPSTETWKACGWPVFA